MPRPLSRTELALLLAGLAVCLVVVHLVFSPATDMRAAGSEGRDNRETEPSLRGTFTPGAARRSAADASRAPLHGTVDREDAGPLGDVQVYLLRRDVDGEGIPPFVTKANERGEWNLSGADPAGHWVVAIAEGAPPAVFDGDTWTGAPVALRISKGRSITVYASPTELLVGDAVHVMASAPADVVRDWPGPGQCRSFDADFVIDPSGEVAVRVPTEGSVRLRLEAPAVRGQPAEQAVPPDTDVAEFHLRTSCLLEVRVTDAETGWSLEMKARATIPGFVLEDPPFEPTRIEDIDVHHFMDFMYMEGLPCGRYDLRVWCDGYLPFVATDLDLERPASHVVVEVALRPDPAMGRLEVKMIVAGQSGLGDLEPHLLLRDLGGDRTEPPDWNWARPRKVDRDAAIVQVGPLEPGLYEVYAWAGVETVGRTRVQVVGGRTAAAEIRLGPGLLVDLQRGETLAPSKHVLWTSVQLVDGRGDPLPPVRFGRHQPPTRVKEGTWEHDAVWAGPTVNLDAVLGPLPVDEIVVTESQEDEPRTWIVKIGD